MGLQICLLVTLIILAGSLPVFSAPKSRGGSSKTPATTYDQKQTGEYNIQLHLKDFQIIAVVGDDSLGSLGGDYDYNYDYADFTVKPPKPLPTKKPDNASSTTETPLLSSKKPNPNNSHPYPIVSPATVKPSTTKKPYEFSHKPSTTLKTTSKPIEVTTTTQKIATTENVIDKEVVTFKNVLTPGQIPVFVQDFSVGNPVNLLKDVDVSANADEDDDEKKGEVVTIVSPATINNVAIVPAEDFGVDSNEQPEQPSLGEILHYRRCAQGFSRDKRGRCRKVRRPPQIPMGITRFASNLAARFRQATSPENPGSPDSLDV